MLTTKEVEEFPKWFFANVLLANLDTPKLDGGLSPLRF